MGDEDRSFDPSKTDRSRAQSPGVGPREISRKRDPDQIPQTPLELDAADDDLRSQPGDEGAVLHANHGTRGEKSDAERGPGPKTRQATKDAISRRR
jgi:hypothetical protein